MYHPRTKPTRRLGVTQPQWWRQRYAGMLHEAPFLQTERRQRFGGEASEITVNVGKAPRFQPLSSRLYMAPGCSGDKSSTVHANVAATCTDG